MEWMPVTAIVVQSLYSHTLNVALKREQGRIQLTVELLDHKQIDGRQDDWRSCIWLLLISIQLHSNTFVQ